MEIILWFFLPVILIIGIATTYSDIKTGLIKNKWIIFGLGYGGVFYLLSFVYSWLTGTDYLIEIVSATNSQVTSFYSELVFNFFASLFLGIVFWLFGYWCAADAKLFLCFSFLTPIFVYENNYIRFFPGANIIVHAFLLLSVILLFEMLRKARLSTYVKALKPMFTLKWLILASRYLFMMHFIFKIFAVFFNLHNSMLLFLVIVFLFRPVLYLKYINNNYFFLFTVILRWILLDDFFSLRFVYEMLFGYTLFYLIIFLFINLPKEVFAEKVKIENLKPGMVLKDRIVRKGNKYIIAKSMETKGEPLVENPSEGISVKDIQKILKVHKEGLFPKKSLDVVTNTCFAPYLFIATLLVIFFNGSLVIFLAELFVK